MTHIAKCQKFDLVQFSTSQISPFLLTYFLRLEQFKIEDISLCSIRKMKDNRWLSLFVKTLFTSHAAMFVWPANRKYFIYGNYNVPRYKNSSLSSYLPCLIDLVCLSWLDYLRFLACLRDLAYLVVLSNLAYLSDLACLTHLFCLSYLALSVLGFLAYYSYLPCLIDLVCLSHLACLSDLACLGV